jgi:hypothetical protein
MGRYLGRATLSKVFGSFVEREGGMLRPTRRKSFLLP